MRKPKILFFDIETTPNLGYTWGKYEQDVLSFKKEWRILCVAYKWLGQKQVHWVGGKNRDGAVLRRLKKLFDQADVVVAHNGDAFDVKKISTRMLISKITPLNDVASIDTLKVAKKHFNFTSNRLNDIAQALGIGSKVKHTGIDLWLGCLQNDPKAWKLMERYNRRDVELLEKVYLRMYPWIIKHPNLARLLDRKHACPKCLSENVVRWGLKPLAGSVQQRWACRKCSGYFYTRKGK